jgi:hypothetical protein
MEYFPIAPNITVEQKYCLKKNYFFMKSIRTAMISPVGPGCFKRMNADGKPGPTTVPAHNAIRIVMTSPGW